MKLKKGISLDTSSPYWLHWEYCPDRPGPDEAYDLPKYITTGDDVEKEVISEILEIIKTFELETELISRINKYLGKKDTN